MPETFGTRLKAERETQGVTLSQLAQQAQVSRSYLHELESGKTVEPGVSIAFRLADALCLPLRFLVMGKQNDQKLFLNDARELADCKRRLAEIERLAKGESENV